MKHSSRHLNARPRFEEVRVRKYGVSFYLPDGPAGTNVAEGLLPGGDIEGTIAVEFRDIHGYRIACPSHHAQNLCSNVFQELGIIQDVA